MVEVPKEIPAAELMQLMTTVARNMAESTSEEPITMIDMESVVHELHDTGIGSQDDIRSLIAQYYASQQSMNIPTGFELKGSLNDSASALETIALDMHRNYLPLILARNSSVGNGNSNVHDRSITFSHATEEFPHQRVQVRARSEEDSLKQRTESARFDIELAYLDESMNIKYFDGVFQGGYQDMPVLEFDTALRISTERWKEKSGKWRKKLTDHKSDPMLKTEIKFYWPCNQGQGYRTPADVITHFVEGFNKKNGSNYSINKFVSSLQSVNEALNAWANERVTRSSDIGGLIRSVTE